MASILQQQSGSATDVAITATFDSAPTSGNILVAIANSDSTLTIDPSWTNRVSDVASMGFYVWDKVAGSSEPSAVTVTPSGSAAGAVSIYELSGAAAFDVAGTAARSSHSAAVTAGSITTTGTAGDLVFIIAALHHWDVVAAIPASPVYDGSFTSLLQLIPTTMAAGVASGHFVGSQVQTVAGTIADSTVTWTNDVFDLSTVMVAYKAATSGGGTAVFNGATATATAAGIPGTFSGASDGGIFALRSGAWVAVEEYAARSGSWV